MRTRILALVAAVVAQWFHGALHAGELPDYMRFREDANGARLERRLGAIVLSSTPVRPSVASGRRAPSSAVF